VVVVAGVSGPAGQVAANLAASLARSGDEVVLVCGDVHAGTAPDLFDGRDGTGLAEVLSGRVKLPAARRRVPGRPSLRVVGPGRDPERAAALLQTGSPRQVVDELRATARWVVVEAPSTTSGVDAQSLAGLADLAILVVTTEETRDDDVADARAQFESVRTVLLGAVVVRGDRRADKRGGRRPAVVPAAAPEPAAAEPGPHGDRAARTRAVPEPVIPDVAPDAEPVGPRGAGG
jgi:Mrp family chromosome partitioning ATPase